MRGKESALLWVLLDGQIRPGDVRTLELYYHGDLIDRFGDFFLIKSSAAWYPRSLEGRSLAKFDLTFTTGSKYLLASVGDRVDSSTSGRSTRYPLGDAEPHPQRLLQPGPLRGLRASRRRTRLPVTVMVSEEAHKKLARRVRAAAQHARAGRRRRLGQPQVLPGGVRAAAGAAVLRHRDSRLAR